MTKRSKDLCLKKLYDTASMENMDEDVTITKDAKPAVSTGRLHLPTLLSVGDIKD